MSGPSLVLLVAVLTAGTGALAGRAALRASARGITLAVLIRLASVAVAFGVLSDYARSGTQSLLLSVLALLPLFLAEAIVRERAATEAQR